MSSRKKIVIIGGGVIGCSTAYYLTSLKPDNVIVTVVERVSIACHSSGKAGGFLSLDWNDRGPVGPLARKSYALHKSLHEELKNDIGIDIGYRELDTFSIIATPDKSGKKNSSNWIDCQVISKEQIGSTKTTAQVDPYLLTNALFQASQKRGTKLVIGNVCDVKREPFGEKNLKPYQVILDKEPKVLEADVVIVAMGAWSGAMEKFFPVYNSFPKITGSRAHSIVIKATAPPEALFVDYRDKGISKEPEIYPRNDGTIYICGEGDDEALPEDAQKILPNLNSCGTLFNIASELSSTLKDAQVLKEQACYLPVSNRSGPIISKVPKYDGAYVATGHGCWGILNAPATGLCLAQMILNEKCDLDLTHFSL